MNYEESRAYIEESLQYGSVLGLDAMRELLKRLGNPQDQLKYIHVAGTNGKGSVLAYLASVLKEAGYQVGRYISPAVFSYRERMDVNQEVISREEFARHVTKVAQVVQEMTSQGLPHPTVFEIETTVAFLFFLEHTCDIVALETGLGGILDATNVVHTTIVSVITPIAMDHMAYLGNTLEEIAYAKAGIIKAGRPVVTASQDAKVMEVLRGVSEEKQSELILADAKEAKVIESDYKGSLFSYKGEEYKVSMAGLYQIDNGILALQTLEVLDSLGYATTREDKIKGMKSAIWHGRFELIREHPAFIVDGAHNPDGANRLAQSIATFFPKRSIYYIMGTFGDKEYHKVAQATAKYAQNIITVTTPRNGRVLPGNALDGKELADVISRYNPRVSTAQSLEQAVEMAYKRAGEEDVIIAFGTLAFIGEITKIVKSL